MGILAVDARPGAAPPVPAEEAPEQVRDVDRELAVFAAAANLDEEDLASITRAIASGNRDEVTVIAAALGLDEDDAAYLGVLIGRALADEQVLHEAAAEYTGVMVALYPAPDLAAKLAVEGGEAPEELHVTLCFLGDSKEIDKGPQRLQTVVKRWAEGVPPIEGELSGTGLFIAGPKPVTYASVDLPVLAQARQDLVNAIEKAGYPLSKDHGFTPHMTLAYGKIDVALKPEPVVFDRVTLSWAGERHSFPFSGELAEGRVSGYTDRHGRVVGDYQRAGEMADEMYGAVERVRHRLGPPLGRSKSPHSPGDRVTISVRSGPRSARRNQDLTATYLGTERRPKVGEQTLVFVGGKAQSPKWVEPGAVRARKHPTSSGDRAKHVGEAWTVLKERFPDSHLVFKTAAKAVRAADPGTQGKLTEGRVSVGSHMKRSPKGNIIYVDRYVQHRDMLAVLKHLSNPRTASKRLKVTAKNAPAVEITHDPDSGNFTVRDQRKRQAVTVSTPTEAARIAKGGPTNEQRMLRRADEERAAEYERWLDRPVRKGAKLTNRERLKRMEADRQKKQKAKAAERAKREEPRPPAAHVKGEPAGPLPEVPEHAPQFRVRTHRKKKGQPQQFSVLDPKGKTVASYTNERKAAGEARKRSLAAARNRGPTDLTDLAGMPGSEVRKLWNRGEITRDDADAAGHGGALPARRLPKPISQASPHQKNDLPFSPQQRAVHQTLLRFDPNAKIVGNGARIDKKGRITAYGPITIQWTPTGSENPRRDIFNVEGHAIKRGRVTGKRKEKVEPGPTPGRRAWQVKAPPGEENKSDKAVDLLSIGDEVWWWGPDDKEHSGLIIEHLEPNFVHVFDEMTGDHFEVEHGAISAYGEVDYSSDEDEDGDHLLDMLQRAWTSARERTRGRRRVRDEQYRAFSRRTGSQLRQRAEAVYGPAPDEFDQKADKLMRSGDAALPSSGTPGTETGRELAKLLGELERLQGDRLSRRLAAGRRGASGELLPARATLEHRKLLRRIEAVLKRFRAEKRTLVEAMISPGEYPLTRHQVSLVEERFGRDHAACPKCRKVSHWDEIEYVGACPWCGDVLTEDMHNQPIKEAADLMESLVSHARYELEKAGLMDKDSDYDGMLGREILRIVKTFSQAGHSGASAAMCTAALEKLLRFETLTPLTSNPEEWMEVSAEMLPPGEGRIWQSRRDPRAFSKDGGKTWKLLEAWSDIEEGLREVATVPLVERAKLVARHELEVKEAWKKVGNAMRWVSTPPRVEHGPRNYEAGAQSAGARRTRKPKAPELAGRKDRLQLV